MSERNSMAARKRWAGVPKDERQKIMSDLVSERWKRTSKKERKKNALKMVEAREKKRKKLSTV